ncbi:hypothetical protein QFZ46_001597 [Microbacterium murale]|uniref:Amidohydrolase 3 domain-containing protein n=1 Tax=Microbacterium murale TaxID=1081040 RepID=A0ABU0P912_9MICO|nr:hypothetical protein [Microbacterium murale]
MTPLLLRGGRVIDPGSGLDQASDVLVEDGRIAAIGSGLEREGARVVDVTGMIVGPGFVDLHSHVNSVAGQRLQAMDGVTTALELEAGLLPVERAYTRALEEGRPINFGFSASWGMARAEVLAGRDADADFVGGLSILADPAWQQDSSPAQLTAWLSRLERELSDGALGIGILQGYAPRTDPAEYRAVNELAARAGAPTFTHVREIVEADPSTPIDGTVEGRADGHGIRWSGSSLPRQQHVPPSHRSGSADHRRCTSGRCDHHSRGVSIWCGQYRDRCCLPRAGAIAGVGTLSEQHRDRRHGRAHPG